MIQPEVGMTSHCLVFPSHWTSGVPEPSQELGIHYHHLFNPFDPFDPINPFNPFHRNFAVTLLNWFSLQQRDNKMMSLHMRGAKSLTRAAHRPVVDSTFGRRVGSGEQAAKGRKISGYIGIIWYQHLYCCECNLSNTVNTSIYVYM
jgi:hypothetical protein